MAKQCPAVPVWAVGPFADATAVFSRPEAQSFVKSEIVKTERLEIEAEEEGLVKEGVEGRA
jgi:hypothetical protein